MPRNVQKSLQLHLKAVFQVLLIMTLLSACRVGHNTEIAPLSMKQKGRQLGIAITALYIFSAAYLPAASGTPFPLTTTQSSRIASSNSRQLSPCNSRPLWREQSITRGMAFSRNFLTHRSAVRSVLPPTNSSAEMQSLAKAPKNISDVLEGIDKKDVLWSVSDFFGAKGFLSERQFYLSHWEGEENWAQISTDDKVLGYLWKRYPLLFVKESEVHRLKELRAKFPYIEIVSVHDLYDSELIFSSELALRLFDERFEFPVSVEDIWFSTNAN